jgi:hypothetical protein
MKNRDSESSRAQPCSAGNRARTLQKSLLCGTLAFLVALGISTFLRTNPVEIEIEMMADTGKIGEVFYAASDQSISHERTVRFEVMPEYRRARVRLPDQPLSVLRLDPGGGEGTVLIRHLTVRQGSKEIRLIDGRRIARLSAAKGLRREEVRRNAVAFVATEGDPYLIFAVPPGFAGARPWQRALGWGLLSALVFALAEVIIAARLRQRAELAQSLERKWAALRQRLSHPIYKWSTLALAPVAGLLWARGHVLPTLMCLSLCLALASTLLAGVVAQSWIEGFRARSSEATRRPGLFQLLWLGQYLIFALAVLITPFAGLLADLTGVHVPLRASLPALLVILLLVTLRIARARNLALVLPTAASGPSTALALLAVFRAMHMHSVHAGPLGHDTYQHVYWTQHIADYGFLTLTARGSDLLDAYPKFFHLLAAAWSALGSSATVGPYVKLMPALQTTFACAFLCELVPSLLDRRESGPERDHPLLRTTLGAFVAWHMTFGDGQQIYDGNDLSGTPRLAAAWVLFGLPLLFLAHRAGTLRGSGPWILGLVPVLAVLGLGVNPVLVPLYLTYSLPLTVLLAALTSDRATRRLPARWPRHFAAGGVVSVLLLLANPFVVSELSHTRLGAAVIASAGVRTAAAGIPDAPTQRPPLCEAPLADCAFKIAKEVVEEGGRQFVDSVLSSDMPAMSGGNYAIVYWLLFSAPLFVVAFRRMTHPGASSQPSRQGAQMFLGILIASAIPAVLYPVVRTFFGKFANQDSNFLFLHSYFSSLRMFLGAWLRCLLPLSSWLLLPTSAVRGGLRLMSWLLVAAIGLVGLSNFQIDSLATHRNASVPWVIDWPELRALGHVDDVVPPHETVVLPARHALLFNRENLLLTLDHVAAAATELKTRMLFMVRLGTSRDFGWQDLQKHFCGAPEDRGALLRSVNARWVLVRAENPRSDAQLDADLWNCGVTLRTLEAEYPPAWSERDLALYRINP